MQHFKTRIGTTHFFVLMFSLASLGLAPRAAMAARVVKVKGRQVLIDNEDTEIQEGKKYFVVIDGKKRAVILITKVKGTKAIGRITKGKALEDASVEPVGKRSVARESEDGSEPAGEMQKKQKKSKSDGGEEDASAEPGLVIGGLLGYAMDSQTVSQNGASVSMSGSGYSLKGYGDMPLSGAFGVIGRAGIEQLNLTGSGTSLTSCTSCTTSIMYATLDGLLRYNFTEGKFSLYGALGLGLHFPMGSSSSNILDPNKISSTTVFFLDAGMNYAMSNKTYLTAHMEYGYFPPSQSVTTSFITLRGGAGWRF